MNEFKFRILSLTECEPKEWLEEWAAQYTGYDDNEHKKLCDEYKNPLPDYFVRIGKWKERIKNAADNRWRENVASVAYVIWMQVEKEGPRCPDSNEVKTFLECWSERPYTNQYDSGSRNMTFGLFRASTLLHFISGGKEYPIFDSRVRTAVGRLLGRRKLTDSIPEYLEVYCPLFTRLAEFCGTQEDLRKLDKALFMFGALTAYPFSISRGKKSTQVYD